MIMKMTDVGGLTLKIRKLESLYLSTTSWHLPRALPMTEGQRHLPSTSREIPCSSNGMESACDAGDQGSIPGLGSSSGEGNGNPLQYSCLENSKDRKAWRATVQAVTTNTHIYGNWTLCCYSSFKNPCGSSGRVRRSVLQGIWWDRSLDSWDVFRNRFYDTVLAVSSYLEKH